MAARMVGDGLGLKPIDLSNRYEPDAGLDSTVRMPIRPSPRMAAPAPPAPGASAPITGIYTPPRGTPPPAPPQSPPPVSTPPAAGGGNMLPQTWNPQLLNFEGGTYGGPAPVTSAPALRAITGQDLGSFQNYMDANFGNLKLDPRWRESLNADPEGFLKGIEGGQGAGINQNQMDQNATRLKGLGAYIRQTLGGATKDVPNPEAQIQYLGQAAFNNGVSRLKEVTAQGSRDEEEQLMAALEARGLSGTGAAAQAVERFRQDKMDNFHSAVANLNQLLVSGEITRLTERDLATLQADLQKRNAESLARIQGALQIQIAKAGQPSALAQFAGTAGGIALGALLSPKAPAAAPTADEISQRLYTDPKNYPNSGSLLNLKTMQYGR